MSTLERAHRLQQEIHDLEELLKEKQTQYTFLTTIGPLVLNRRNCYPDISFENTFMFREHACYGSRKFHEVKSLTQSKPGEFKGVCAGYEPGDKKTESFYFVVDQNFQVRYFGWMKHGPRYVWCSKRRVYLCDDIDCSEGHEFKAVYPKKKGRGYSSDSSEGALVYQNPNEIVDKNVWEEKDHNAKKYVKKRWWHTRSRVKEKTKKMKVKYLRSLRR